METTEPLEPSSSSGQDVENPETNGSEPSTANGANTIEARAVTFDQVGLLIFFIFLCYD